MIKSKSLNKNREGAALIWVIILFVIIVILSTSALFIGRQNTFEIIKQDERMKAYYLSLSGIEMGYALLMAEDTSTGENYIKGFGDSHADITHTETIKDSTIIIGTVDITIGNKTIDGKKWIEVKSIGKLKDKNVSSSNIMRIDKANNNIIVREQFPK